MYEKEYSPEQLREVTTEAIQQASFQVTAIRKLVVMTRHQWGEYGEEQGMTVWQLVEKHSQDWNRQPELAYVRCLELSQALPKQGCAVPEARRYVLSPPVIHLETSGVVQNIDALRCYAREGMAAVGLYEREGEVSQMPVGIAALYHFARANIAVATDREMWARQDDFRPDMYQVLRTTAIVERHRTQLLPAESVTI